jgi:hypothetical protein
MLKVAVIDTADHRVNQKIYDRGGSEYEGDFSSTEI